MVGTGGFICFQNKKEYTKKCTRGGAPLHELLICIVMCSSISTVPILCFGFLSGVNCGTLSKVMDNAADLDGNKNREMPAVSPVNFDDCTFVPTLALSKSGVRVEVLYFLSA